MLFRFYVPRKGTLHRFLGKEFDCLLRNYVAYKSGQEKVQNFQDIKIFLRRISITKLNLYSEPVGAKAPTLSVDAKRSWIERPLNNTFAIFCPAQAYPVPAFRLLQYF